MPNTNTVASAANLPSAAAGASSAAATQFKNHPDPAVGSDALAVATVEAGVADKRVMRVRAGGRFKAAAGNITIDLYQGNTAAASPFTGNTKVATSGAITVAGTGNDNFYMEVEILLDSTSSVGNGRFSGYVSTTRVAQTALSTALSALNPATTAIPFNVVFIFGTSNAGNSAILDFLEVDLL